MILTLPGTGANECIPAFRCTCQVCSNARKWRGKELRQNSCAVVESSSGGLTLIDMPPQILALLNQSGLDDAQIKQIFFTHRHEDHILGARSLFQWKPGKGFQIEEAVEVYLPRSVWSSMSRKFLSDKKIDTLPMTSGSYQLNFMSDSQSVIRDDVKITPLETGHLMSKSPDCGEETLGYLFEEKNGSTLAYMMDTPKDMPDAT